VIWAEAGRGLMGLFVATSWDRLWTTLAQTGIVLVALALVFAIVGTAVHFFTRHD
jgi:hypothetical protein